MSIFAGGPPEPQQTETDPPFKFEEQKHTGQALPPESDGHPLTDGSILDMLDRTDR